MRIAYGEYPPNIEEIAAVFPTARGYGVLFTYGGTLFNPSRVLISSPLMAHEEVHQYQQENGTIKGWWDRYLTDSEFRFEQELAAHRAEYKHYCDGFTDRNARSAMLSRIARRLAGPLYGGMISISEAKGRIR